MAHRIDWYWKHCGNCPEGGLHMPNFYPGDIVTLRNDGEEGKRVTIKEETFPHYFDVIEEPNKNYCETCFELFEPEMWDLEEVPYETNDPAGGWYLHFDMTGESTDNVLYMSKANVTEQQATQLAAVPELVRAIRRFVRYAQSGRHPKWATYLNTIAGQHMIEALRKAGENV